MKEHKTYNGEVIKQADVNLLAYPLELITDENIVKRDLEYYEPLISKEGPAMGLSVLSVIYARMGNSEKAFDLFKRSYIPNKRSPFGALAESATSNNPYFATGAGGMLQEVIFGFGGLHFTEAGIIETKPNFHQRYSGLRSRVFANNPGGFPEGKPLFFGDKSNEISFYLLSISEKRWISVFYTVIFVI